MEGTFTIKQCLLCNYKTDKQAKLSHHTGFYHNLKFPEYLIQVKYNNIKPLCGCGCGVEMNYNPSQGDFYKFKQGHQAKINKEQFGDPKNPLRVAKIKTTRKAKFASGEYDYIKKAIKSREPIELGKKISKGAKGVPKPKPKGFGVGRVQSQETKDKMSDSAIKRIIKNNRNHTSKLEIKFAEVLSKLNINYIQWFYAKEIKGFYDFYLPKYNIIIETDGNFYHCNPIIYTNGPVCKTQIKNIERDKQKNEWAKNNGFKLLRFWEKDINENPQLIIETLKTELNIS